MSSIAGPSSSPTAYAKAVLHAVKYSAQPVMGLLLGKPPTRSGGSLPVLAVLDAVPLTHVDVAAPSHPIIDAAVLQVAAVGKSRGLSIVGVYHANAVYNDRSAPQTVREFVRHVAEALPTAYGFGSGGSPLVLWILHGDDLLGVAQPSAAATSSSASLAVSWQTFEGGSWSPNTPSDATPFSFGAWNGDACRMDAVPNPRAALEAVRGLAEKRGLCAGGQAADGGIPLIVDFEDHLEDCRLDYFNPEVEKQLPK